MGDREGVKVALDAAAAVAKDSQDERRFSPLAALLVGIARNKMPAKELYSKDSTDQLEKLIADCLQMAGEDSAPLTTRIDCVHVVGRRPKTH